ncbi:uncharacterized protein LOC130747595 [Lotus japonicus]|uniref:uncharacterized protein LOC130747595 n=1 Tax=Lotus japonicus TaxID=34305 RepID=UPI002583E72E|nr:uncharacterized protein LOC130747595 [Lotus japonicus]
MGSWINNQWHWDFRWSATVVGSLENQRSKMMNIVSAFSLLQGRSDTWWWVKERNGLYSVHSAYESIADNGFSEDEFVFRIVWKILAPSNAQALGWKILINRIPTKDNLLHRNVPLASTVCSLCLSLPESADHLLFTCSFAWQVWSLVVNWLGWRTVLPGSAKDHLIQFSSWGSAKTRIGLSCVWLAVIWQLWIVRNGVIFRNEAVDLCEVFEQVKLKSWLWLKAKSRGFSYSYSEWCGEPMVCFEVL